MKLFGFFKRKREEQSDSVSDKNQRQNDEHQQQIREQLEEFEKILAEVGIKLAIMREQARQQGYYHVEDLGDWSESDREIYLQHFKSLNILYIHGLSSSGQSETASRLRRYLPDDKIFAPDLPIEPAEALEMLKTLVEREQIDLVIGTSMGGMFAQKLRGVAKILINPSFHVSQSMRGKLGINEFFSPRQDGVMEYEITEELCDRYKELEQGQFDNLSDEERELTLGFFGLSDDVVDCSLEYERHYPHHSNFHGGHRLTEQNIKFDLLYYINQYRDNRSWRKR